MLKNKNKGLSLAIGMGIGSILGWYYYLTPMASNRFSFTHQQWPIAVTPGLSFQIQDITQPYDLLLSVKKNKTYPYYNLYITYYLADETEQVCATALKEYILFDVQTGKPQGEDFVLLQQYYFSHPGLYRLTIEQGMRTDPLPGISSIEIVVKKAMPS